MISKLSKLGTILATTPDMIYRLGLMRMGRPASPSVYYVVPSANWATDWVGRYVATGVEKAHGRRIHVTSAPHALAGHVVHYGELGGFIASLGKRRNKRNAIVTTVFHGSRSKEFPALSDNIEQLIANADSLSRVVTANKTMEQRMRDWGLPAEKVVRVPLGVDLGLFQAVAAEKRAQLRERVGIAADAFCIGSFQKDGVGWGEGLEPKLVKGPDVFLSVIDRLKDNYKLHILLTAPARGYVKRGLDRLGVRYTHENRADYRDVAPLYGCLDACLVTSRDEGGPLAVLEALASGVPVVSTRIGLAADVLEHGRNGFVTDSEDVDALAESVSRIADSQDVRDALIAEGLNSIVQYDWQAIASRYYTQLYQPLLEEVAGEHASSARVTR